MVRRRSARVTPRRQPHLGPQRASLEGRPQLRRYEYFSESDDATFRLFRRRPGSKGPAQLLVDAAEIAAKFGYAGIQSMALTLNEDRLGG